MRDPLLNNKPVVYDEKLVNQALEDSSSENVETSIEAINYLKSILCDINDMVILRHIVRTMTDSREIRVIDACLDAIFKVCHMRQEELVESSMFLVWDLELFQCTENGNHIDLEMFFLQLKKRHPKTLAEYILSKVLLSSRQIYDDEKFEYITTLCHIFDRNELIEHNLMEMTTNAFYQNIQFEKYKNLMFEKNMVDYLDLADKIITKPDCLLTSTIAVNDFQILAETVIIKANQFRERNQESNEKEKAVIDKYLKLLFPNRTLDAAERLHGARILSDVDMNKIKEQLNKLSSFHDNWFNSDVDAPQSSS